MIRATEILANGVIATSILLAGRNSIHTWWTGVIGCLIFAYLFYESRLYAEFILQFFFVITSLIGWWQWSKGNYGTTLHISRINRVQFIWVTVFGLIVASIYGALLQHYTLAYAPFIDSAVLVFSVIAQIFLMRRHLETWLFWLLANTIAVPLYTSRTLYLTAVLYVIFWINALISFKYWHQLEQTALARETK